MDGYVIVAILVVALITTLLRMFPFIVLAKRQVLPIWIQFMSRQLPKSIMVILIVYCLKSVRVMHRPYGVPELIALLLVVGLHRWKRNMLLSIFIPTIFYMFCTHYFL